MLDLCYYVTKSEFDIGEEITTVKGYDSDVSAEKFFTDVSRILCFDDCAPITVCAIVWHGKAVHYCGWMPGMHYQYEDESGNLVWEGWFAEWDH